jgi:AmmeMemoRadiSam system protein B
MLVLPHAGYVYSGDVAALGYAPLARWRERITRVVLLGPVHRVAVRGLAAPTVGAFETPLGRVPLDTRALDTLGALRQVVQVGPAACAGALAGGASAFPAGRARLGLHAGAAGSGQCRPG